MKKNKIIQFSLIIVGLVLFVYTYYSGEKTDISTIDKNISTDDNTNSTKQTRNVIENANYNGTDNRGTFFNLDAELAKIYYEEPNLSNLEIVNAVINLRDGKKIYIQSDICVYNRITNDAKFSGNVIVTESNSKITSDNLDLIMTENLITIYNNVKYNGEKGFLIADKVDIDILNNESNIFMFDKKNRVKAKYKN